MCIGPDEGCHEVPDPIAPIDITFFSLEPTRMPISFPIITINGPVFIEPIGIPGISDIGLPEGLGDGIGMFIGGEAEGVGDAAGICIPGVPSIVPGDELGDGVGAGFCAASFFIGMWP